MNFKELRESATQNEIRDLLEKKAVWTVQDSAGYLAVTTAFYRRNILDLPNHPAPIDPNAKNLQWWRDEMVPFLSAPANLKWPEGARRRSKCA